MASQRKAALGFILVTVLIDVMGIGIIIPVMPKLVSQLTGGGMSEAARWGGWMVFAYALMLFICSPFMGGLSDRFGRRPVLLASLFGFGIDYLFLSFAPTIGWLFVGRAVAGMMGASMTTCSAYIADITPPEKRAQSFGLIGAVFAIGLTLGPLLGGLLGSFGPRAPFVAAAVLTLVNWLYGLLILPESLAPANRRPFEWSRANPVGSLRNLGRYPVIAGLAASLVLVQIAVFAVQCWLALLHHREVRLERADDRGLAGSGRARHRPGARRAGSRSRSPDWAWNVASTPVLPSTRSDTFSSPRRRGRG